MNPSQDIAHTAGVINRRLFLLVFRALAGVLLMLVLLLVVSAWAIIGWINMDPTNAEPLLVYMLESHYEARGSWAGVSSVFKRSPSALVSIYQRHWNDSLLLDDTGRVIVDHGQADSPIAGQLYQIPAEQLNFPLKSGGYKIGTLVLEGRGFLEPFQVFFPILVPFSILAISLGCLALIIGLLLLRRVVLPLAEVIAAARSVADGNLSTRVKSSGPSDMRVLSDSFNQMAESLDKNDRERRELLAIIAHELRTPLTVLRGRLEGIVDGIYPADGAHIASVLEETYLMERLVEDLRLLALAEARQLHFDARSVHLEDLALRAVDLFMAEAEENQIQLSVEIGSVSSTIYADPQRLEQAVGNLVSNALRYVPSGKQVVVKVSEMDGRVELAVRDNGGGVPEADLARIFDRFWRVDPSRARSSGGTGLGLAIAKELVEAQDGQIMARNHPEGGLEVKISFKTRE